MSTPPKINLELKNTASILASGIVTICEIIRSERVRALIISKDNLIILIYKLQSIFIQTIFRYYHVVECSDDFFRSRAAI
jgi:hypothetical protein